MIIVAICVRAPQGDVHHQIRFAVRGPAHQPGTGLRSGEIEAFVQVAVVLRFCVDNCTLIFWY